MTTFSHSSTTPSVSVTTASGNNQSQLVATPVPDEQRISFWPQHFGLIPQWVTLEPISANLRVEPSEECDASVPR